MKDSSGSVIGTASIGEDITQRHVFEEALLSAKENLNDKDFDVILSDFNILGFDGLQVLEKKRLQHDRSAALEALKRSEIKYRSLFENMQDVFYQIDGRGIITEISPSIFRLAGYRREELIGQPVTTFYADPGERETMLWFIAQQGEVWDFEVRLKTKSGKVKYASLNAHSLPGGHHREPGLEGSLRDIDERKRME